MAVGDKLDVEGLVGMGLARPDAERCLRILAQHGDERFAAWRALCQQVLRPDHPFELHQALHRSVFREQPGPAPVWIPGAAEMKESNVGRLMARFGLASFAQLHRLGIDEPERFWPVVLEALGIAFDTPPARMLDVSQGAEAARWLVHARLNIAQCALERGAEGRPAVVFQREGGKIETRTLGQLGADVRRLAGSLAARGLGEGEAVAIDMPMTYESVVVYLAVVTLGGAVVSIADSFAASEIATRLRIGEAKAIFTQDVILRGDKTLPLYSRVCEAGAPLSVVIPAGQTLAVELREGDLSWDELLATAGAERPARYAVRDVEATTNILFSSGTTGEPKAIPWTQVTPIKAAADGFAHHDIREGDVVCWPTNLGWMMGPWLIYASLLNDATIALFDGSPLGRPFGRFVQDAGVTMLGVVPSLVKAWKASGCLEGLDWQNLRCFSSTGEASTPGDMHWLTARAGYKPVIEYCGGTEIGGGYISGTVVEPQVASAFSTPAIGCDFVIVDDEGRPADTGELCLLPPMLGSSNRLLNRDHHEVYYEGMPPGPNGEVLRRHGDHMRRLPGGYYRALGRVDDTMNLGGIKTSSAEIERVCNRIGGVHETAAIAVSPDGGGPSRLVIYAVTAVERSPAELRDAFQQAIRRDLNPLFKVHEVVNIDSLPRTASNKVMRRVLRRRYQDED